MDRLSKKKINARYIADFLFTLCLGICPKTTANMNISQEHFLKCNDILLLFRSVTPEKDFISILNDYSESKGALSNKWYLVIEAQQEIYRLGGEDYFQTTKTFFLSTAIDIVNNFS